MANETHTTERTMFSRFDIPASLVALLNAAVAVELLDTADVFALGVHFGESDSKPLEALREVIREIVEIAHASRCDTRRRFELVSEIDGARVVKVRGSGHYDNPELLTAGRVISFFADIALQSIPH